MASPDVSGDLSFAELTPATPTGRELLAALADLLTAWGVPPRELPAAARVPATTTDSPAAQLADAFGVYLAAHGDAVVVVWHAASSGAADTLLNGLTEALAGQGVTGPLAELDDPPSFRPLYRLTIPDAADACAVLVELADG